MSREKVIVTGGSGKAGRACIADLLAHGYSVVNVDQAAPQKSQCPFVKADLNDFGQTLDVLSGVDGKVDHDIFGVVHLAAIPAPGMLTNAATFQNNILSTYHIFEAAKRLGINNVVWASSETVLGLPFDTPPPYVPMDEDAPASPESAYSLSKYLGEAMAEQFCRWNPLMKIIGLRFSNVMEPQDYAAFPDFDSDARRRKWNLWGYIDARDAAQAVRRSLEATVTGADVFVIANADTTMSRPNAELLAEVFPDVPIKREVGPNETLLSIEKARRILGYEPEHNWRSALAGTESDK
ncbi:MAG: NAD(P)-dependent oxidoreductase [Armatimonadota bacterium]